MTKTVQPNTMLVYGENGSCMGCGGDRPVRRSYFAARLSFGKTRFNTAVGNLLGYLARDLIFPLENIYRELRERN